MRLAALIVASSTLACHSPTPKDAEKQPEAARMAPPGASMTLEQNGCSIELAGSWKSNAESSEDEHSWSAERIDANESLTIHPLPWKAPKLEAEWREDLGSTLELRRYADKEHGATTVSDIEYWGDGKDPGAFITSVWAQDGEGVLTISKASPTLACLFFVVVPLTEHAELAQRAREILPKAHASTGP